MGPFGPVWAHMGPARALEKRKKIWKVAPLFCPTHFVSKIVVFDLQTMFFDGFHVFFTFLAEIRFRTIMKLPQKTNLETKMQTVA